MDDEENYLVSYYTIPRPWVFNDQQMKVYHFTNYQEVSDQVHIISNQMNTVIVVVICILIIILYLSIKNAGEPHIPAKPTDGGLYSVWTDNRD